MMAKSVTLHMILASEGAFRRIVFPVLLFACKQYFSLSFTWPTVQKKASSLQLASFTSQVAEYSRFVASDVDSRVCVCVCVITVASAFRFNLFSLLYFIGMLASLMLPATRRTLHRGSYFSIHILVISVNGQCSVYTKLSGLVLCRHCVNPSDKIMVGYVDSHTSTGLRY